MTWLALQWKMWRSSLLCRSQQLSTQSACGNNLEYARLGQEVALTTSIWSVICAVDEYRVAPHKSDPRPPASPPCASLHQENKTIPDLKEFTRKDEDYFSWRDSTVNDLGKAGLIHFTNDPNTITKYPELATSAFYALRAALQNRMVSNFATTLYDDNKCNPLSSGRTSSSGMMPQLTVPTWCCLQSKSC